MAPRGRRASWRAPSSWLSAAPTWRRARPARAHGALWRAPRSWRGRRQWPHEASLAAPIDRDCGHQVGHLGLQLRLDVPARSCDSSLCRLALAWILFQLRRDRLPADQYRAARTRAFQVWAPITGVAVPYSSAGPGPSRCILSAIATSVDGGTPPKPRLAPRAAPGQTPGAQAAGWMIR